MKVRHNRRRKRMNGWKKALTFSYDDGVLQDRRMVALLNKYGMKATFNLNSELLGQEEYLIREGVKVNHTKVAAKEVRGLYEGHEIAVHTLRHTNLSRITDTATIIRQVESDRENLSCLAGYPVVGMAYPGGGVNYTEKVAELIKNYTEIKYARTTICNYGFEKQRDLFQFKPSVYHVMEMEKMFDLGRKFLEMKPDSPQIFYIWGHSYELDIHDTWSEFERFLEMLSGNEDIFYGTNREVLLDSL